MPDKAQPLFIVGCGRSGTQALGRLFDSYGNVTMHHEYMVHHVQPLGVEYWHGRVGRDEVMASLRSLYGAAISFSETPVWGDCSNKLSWFVDILAGAFPEARFIHLVRDGRKAVSSLYHKLGHECLDDRSVNALRAYLEADGPKPPPEKKYWWPMARRSDEIYQDYQSFDHFSRIAYHWAQINREVRQKLGLLEQSRYIRVRLEDITASRENLEDMLSFAGLPLGEEQVELMVRPHNVIKPVNFMLEDDQLETFWTLAGAEMKALGYDTQDEYVLEYNPTRGNA
ncbi:sulfotransferase family protein [Kordiimonas aestuarii]|uniref:sulfotransferase family protein n=1 Tax=Kordiimonas aestuarii TaxID=1005925 RepID=UPI0021D02F9D|nr:sulfotransferase [Kordiimonas aestuarii]